MLEQSTTDLLDVAVVGVRVHHEMLARGGFNVDFDGRSYRVDLQHLTGGKQVLVYDQTDVERFYPLLADRV